MTDFSVPKVAKPEHILVVDDTVDNLLLVQTLLQEEGYEVAIAENGYSALEQIIKLLSIFGEIANYLLFPFY